MLADSSLDEEKSHKNVFTGPVLCKMYFSSVVFFLLLRYAINGTHPFVMSQQDPSDCPPSKHLATC